MVRILIAEDDPLIGLLLSEWLEEIGWTIVGPATNAAEALALIGTGIDAAVLDVTLAGGDSFAVAAALRAAGVPFDFASGHGTERIAAEFRDAPLLGKPFDFDGVEAMVRRLVAGAPGEANRPDCPRRRPRPAAASGPSRGGCAPEPALPCRRGGPSVRGFAAGISRPWKPHCSRRPSSCSWRSSRSPSSGCCCHFSARCSGR
jgi:CheY-like chemotaxis protein